MYREKKSQLRAWYSFCGFSVPLRVLECFPSEMEDGCTTTYEASRQQECLSYGSGGWKSDIRVSFTEVAVASYNTLPFLSHCRKREGSPF